MASIADILTQLGISYKDVGDNLRVRCWLHNDKTPSLFVHKQTGVYHCFSCHAKGNIINLIKQHTDMEYHEILLYLKNLSLGGITETERRDKLAASIARYNKVLHKEEQPYEGCILPENKKIKSHKYLIDKRGITLDEINKYDIRVCVDKNFNGFNYDGWVLFPIYYKGVLRSFFLRDPAQNRKIYGKYDRSDILYGYDQLTDLNGIVCVTEGMFDKIFCERIGQQSVAALSNRLLEGQIQALKSFKEVVIFHDNDATEIGLYLVKDALDLLLHTKVSVASVPLDIKDCANIFPDSKYTAAEILDITKKAFDNRIPLPDFYASRRYRHFLVLEHERLQAQGRRAR